jgi:predicted Fe-Mo cluster-binding NifX family protein
MRIAVVSDDEATISQHFGRAPHYVVVTVEDGKIVSRETRAKAGHGTSGACDCQAAPGEPHGQGQHSEAKHQIMADTISDCDVLISGGMGWGAHESLKRRGIEPVITDVRDVAEAALAYASGTLPNLTERLH